MKKKILVFIAVLAISFATLLPFKSSIVRADETSSNQATLVYTFDYPYYLTNSYGEHGYFLVNNIILYLSSNTLTVRMLVNTGSLAAPVYEYSDILFYEGLPSNSSAITRINPAFFEVYRSTSSNIFEYANPVYFTIRYTFSGLIGNISSFIESLDYITTSYDLSSKSFYIDIYFINGDRGTISLVLDSSDIISSSYLFYLYTEYTPVVYNLNNSLYSVGYAQGKSDGYYQGKSEGDAIGFQRGFDEAKELYQVIGDLSFFGLISAVVDVPVKAFTNLFNFEILGINLFDFMTGLLTLALVLTIFRIIFR